MKNVVDFLKAIGMSKRADWEGSYIPPSNKEDVVRAEFALRGWKRDNLGRMNKGNLHLVFVFNQVRLKKYVDGQWKTIQRASLDALYEKLA